MRVIDWVKKVWSCVFDKPVTPKKSNSETDRIQGKMVIDLTALGSGPTECQMALSPGDGGVLEDYLVLLEGLNADQINTIFGGDALKGGMETSGTLADGREFRATIATFTSFHPGMNGTMWINGKLNNVSLDPPATQGRKPEQWAFVLCNVKLHCGDSWSSYPAERRQAADSIEFEVNGRRWRLTDLYNQKWGKLTREEQSKPIASGLLRSSFQADDNEEAVRESVQDICNVLAVALSRSVNWVSYELRDSRGRAIKGYSRSTWVTAFGKHGFAPVDNHEPFALKSLLEKALPIVTGNRDWYNKTLGMLIQAQIADMLEVRCSILYTLADRISSFLVKSKGTFEIDKDLKARARKPEFGDELHVVLTQLSPDKWTRAHTDAVIGEVKRWNTMPTFIAKIQRACTLLSIPEPDKELLRPRNDLLHDGELDPENADTKTHYLELDWVVLVMSLRLFNYDGVYYHPKIGHAPVNLGDHLVAPPGPSSSL